MDKFYLITFTPLGRFYFGSSNSWGESFYASSLKFPTQTTILGCLRRSMLKQNDLLDDSGRYPKKDDNGQIKSLTGKSKAKGLDETELDLGIIKKLSPVFVTELNSNGDIENFLFPLPVDVYKKNESNLGILEYERKDSRVTSRSENYGYKKITTGKVYPAEIMGNKNMWDNYLQSKELDYNSKYEMDKIIIPTTQPGIARKERIKEDGAFYRKKDFIMAQGFSYAIISEVDNGFEKLMSIYFESGSLVFLGGEQSKFIMKVMELNDDGKSKIPTGVSKFFNGYDPTNGKITSNSAKVILLSHLLTDENPTGIEHSVIEKMETIRSLNESGHKTYSFKAIPSGSVFYTNGNFSFPNNYKFATKIGYNFFIEIN